MNNFKEGIDSSHKFKYKKIKLSLHPRLNTGVTHTLRICLTGNVTHITENNLWLK